MGGWKRKSQPIVSSARPVCSRFEWSIAKADQEHVSVEPSSGLLLPNEIQAHQIRLRATGDKVCHYKPFIKVSSDLCKLVAAFLATVMTHFLVGAFLEKRVDYSHGFSSVCFLKNFFDTPEVTKIVLPKVLQNFK